MKRTHEPGSPGWQTSWDGGNNRKSTGRPRIDPVEVHGNIRTYERGCRCALCRKTNAQYSKAFRAKQKQMREAAALDALKTPLQRLKESWGSQ